MTADPERAWDVPPSREGPGGTTPARDDDAPPCDLCGHPMIERHCKLVCFQCGYQRDCSDP